MKMHAGFIFAAVLVSAIPAHALQRAFVASYGNDANTASGCLLANPCRGFAAAMTVVDPGGEIIALDAAGYAPVTINKSVTITANPGFYAGISVASGTGVTIATAGVVVTLRGLNINGIGGTTGISMTAGNRLSIENCVISNFGAVGVSVNAAAKVRVVDSLIRDNGAEGVLLQGGATADVIRTTAMGNGFVSGSGFAITAEGTVAATTTTLTVTDSFVAGNSYGIGSRATGAGNTAASVARTTSSNNGGSGIVVFQPSTGTAIMTLTDSVVVKNQWGLVGNSGTFESAGNNTVRQNATQTLGTITPVPQM